MNIIQIDCRFGNYTYRSRIEAQVNPTGQAVPLIPTIKEVGQSMQKMEPSKFCTERHGAGQSQEIEPQLS
ncbi:unnamed protein product [Onchocerca ochengi]|uniref:Uncharacterized protein n=1 Tax=Onchocerca ochengi TaxID=42157 RepID=A0A182EHD9_ONCOC|nr:unnamed protein product [Onchocerca ochengi]